eukprot:SAG22_NODE_435_length_10524_cov_8.503789_2_plen_409_part_00
MVLQDAANQEKQHQQQQPQHQQQQNLTKKRRTPSPERMQGSQGSNIGSQGSPPKKQQQQQHQQQQQQQQGPGAATAAADEQLPVHIEVYMKEMSTARTEDVEDKVLLMLQDKALTYEDGPIDFADSGYLAEHVMSISVCDLECRGQPVSFWQASHYIHICQLNQDGQMQEVLDGEDEGGGDAVAASNQLMLPAVELHGTWESLVYDTDLKRQMLQYASTAMLFADSGVDSNLISFNRIILLHGPPGTGKTSLSKALAQKLSVRLSHRYSNSVLVEINAHSLFSKWFSESGKLVMKLFDKISELADDEECLCCVVIDEVESLTAARKAASSGNEPSDAIRVVNALLTQLDQLRTYTNVLIVATSNGGWVRACVAGAPPCVAGVPSERPCRTVLPAVLSSGLACPVGVPA